MQMSGLQPSTCPSSCKASICSTEQQLKHSVSPRSPHPQQHALQFAQMWGEAIGSQRRVKTNVRPASCRLAILRRAHCKRTKMTSSNASTAALSARAQQLPS
ncbi:unnamed protein product [Pleuronectes platessa]|uniref:Uncharacterized protein n=1 Tax=Pleuronectes platessa TaxID=8262 RepID=A0A9N7UFW4_PLEPL|nr:unnamed protein product [Pleuronectes platessa]